MAKDKTKQTLRSVLTENIMKNKFGDDDPKYNGSNLNFLNTLTVNELHEMATPDWMDAITDEALKDVALLL